MGNPSKRLRPSQYALASSGTTFIAVTIWLLLTAPDQLPSRFEESGEITDWMDLDQYVTVTSAFALGTALVCGGARWYVPKVPDRALNPTGLQSNYWAQPENRKEFNTKLIDNFEWIGVLITLILLTVTCLAGITAAGVHLPFWIKPTATMLPMLALLVYAGNIAHSRRYSPPPRTPHNPQP